MIKMQGFSRLVNNDVPFNLWKAVVFVETLTILILSFGTFKLNQILSQERQQISSLRSRIREIEELKGEKPVPLKVRFWREFSDPRYSFSLRYPQDWSLERVSPTQVRVVNYSNQCRDCLAVEKQGYYEFSIRDDGMLEDKEVGTALMYILKEWLKFIKEETERCVGQEVCLPTVPGFTQKYIGPASYLFVNQDISTVEVSPYYYSPADGDKSVELFENEYVILTKGKHLYTINVISPWRFDREDKSDLEEGHPLAEIIRSLSFE